MLATAALAAPPDARDIVRRSIHNGEQSWRKSFDYSCVEHEIERQLDASGRVVKKSDDVADVIALGYGTSFEMPVQHDGEPVAAAVREKAGAELARRRAESPAQKRRRFAKEESERAYMKEVADAFDFRITGEANLPTGKAWVIEARPRAGFTPRTRYGRMFRAMRGTLWVDQRDLEWVKADAVAEAPVSFAFFIARLAQGSHIVLEQMRLPDGTWVPKHVAARASATTFLFFHHRFDDDITYSGYRKAEMAMAPPRGAAAQ